MVLPATRVKRCLMSRNAALFALMCLVWGLTWLPIKVGAQHVEIAGICQPATKRCADQSGRTGDQYCLLIMGSLCRHVGVCPFLLC